MNKSTNSSINEISLFSDLNISPVILKAITELGYETPTPIQAQAIPLLLEGKDILGQAQTGTGKTAAFGIPLIETIDTHARSVQAIILCPTRELAIQVTEDLAHLSKYKKDIRLLSIYGGQSIERQFKALKSGVNIVVGTPGRVQDHIDRGTLKLDGVKIVVLDEADEMLNMGFREAIEEILTEVPKERQTILFSATMPPAILKLTKKFQINPVEVKIHHKEVTVPGIEQVYFEIRDREKLDLISILLDINQFKLSLVFCNTKRAVDNLVEHLNARGFLADSLHGDLRQQQRDQVMKKFRTGKLDILVATDVAARGLDVDDIDAVFNYDFPQDEEYYVHRIGRTGRAGKKGIAYSFVTVKEIYRLKDIKRYTNAKIVRMDVPSATDVEAARTNKVIEKLNAIINTDELSGYVRKIENMLSEEITLTELAAALLKMATENDRPVPEISPQKESFDSEKKKFGNKRFGDKKFGDRNFDRKDRRRDGDRDDRRGPRKSSDRNDRNDRKDKDRSNIVISSRDIESREKGRGGDRDRDSDRDKKYGGNRDRFRGDKKSFKKSGRR
jgi:ATP-dependent RNA helicase DeaD